MGEVIGIRVSKTLSNNADLAPSLGGYAIASNTFSILLPELQAGLFNRAPDEDTGGSLSEIPPIPATFRGGITVDGGLAKAGSIIYAKISKAGLPDHWSDFVLPSGSEYVIAIAPMTSKYQDGTIEFWYENKKATVGPMSHSLKVSCMTYSYPSPRWYSNDSCTANLNF